MKTMNTVSSVAVAENTAVATKAVVTGGKTMTNFAKLSDKEQTKVKGLVEVLVNELGGEKIDYKLLVGAIDLLNAEKKAAKDAFDAQEKERKQAEKEVKEANGGKLHDVLTTSDVVDYSMTSKKLVIKGVKILKITDKRFHVEIAADTDVQLSDGKVVKASEVADLTLGKKYVAFTAITSVNGIAPAKFLSAKAEAKAEAEAEAKAN